jgi:hypothetical protein
MSYSHSFPTHESEVQAYVINNKTAIRADLFDPMFTKGGTLQHGLNQGGHSKVDKYVRAIRGQTGTRKTTYASKNQKTTMPVMTSMARVGGHVRAYDGTRARGRDLCPKEQNAIRVGGELVAGIEVAPCGGAVVAVNTPPVVFSPSDADVPGDVPLNWTKGSTPLAIRTPSVMEVYANRTWEYVPK